MHAKPGHSRSARMRIRVLAVLIVLAATSAACGDDDDDSEGAAPAEGEATSISFGWDWLPDGDWAPMLWAEENGYFEEENLDVTYEAGEGSSATLPLIASGEFDMGQISAPPLVLSVPEDLPVTVVGVMQTASPNVILCDGSIQEPQDMEGRVFGDQAGEFEHALWIAWAAANDVDVDAVNSQPVSGGSDVLFTDGELDCYIDFWTSGAMVNLTEGRPGEETTFLIRDSLDIYGHTMAVNNDFLEENPEAVRGFLRAYAEGMKYASDHPDETVDLLLERFPELDRAAEEWSVPKYIEAWNSDLAREEGFLAFEPDGWESTLDAIVAGGLMEEVDISDLYTTEYLPEDPVMP
jgi:NitT/TauT family transport system substrate-binding protein